MCHYVKVSLSPLPTSCAQKTKLPIVSSPVKAPVLDPPRKDSDVNKMTDVSMSTGTGGAVVGKDSITSKIIQSSLVSKSEKNTAESTVTITEAKVSTDDIKTDTGHAQATTSPVSGSSVSTDKIKPTPTQKLTETSSLQKQPEIKTMPPVKLDTADTTKPMEPQKPSLTTPVVDPSIPTKPVESTVIKQTESLPVKTTETQPLKDGVDKKTEAHATVTSSAVPVQPSLNPSPAEMPPTAEKAGHTTPAPVPTQKQVGLLSIHLSIISLRAFSSSKTS